MNRKDIIDIKKLIQDVTATHAGMSYLTPKAFTGTGKTDNEILDRILKIWKWELVQKDEFRVNEALEPADYSKIRSLIRSELASVMYFLFKKRGMWIDK